MQLTSKTSIRNALTTVTAALLGSTVAHATGDKQFESSILLYSETDRVKAAEGIFDYTQFLKGGRIINARFTLDGLTGASPNGATPSSQIQTFTRPSGNGSYTVLPGETPLDDTFKDTRYSFDGSLTQPINRITTAVIGAHFSTEHDYTSLGVNAGLTRDLNKKNTTLSLSAALSHDLVRPHGGEPNPLTPMVAPGNSGSGDDDENEHEGGAGKSKNIFDGIFGITQVLNRMTVLRFNYSFNHTSGYLNDPYKILSIVQGPADSIPGEPIEYLYESRPNSRTKHAVYGQVRRFLGGHTIDLSYRYFWDNWGINSQTIDIYYRLPLMSDHFLQPHFRWYKQSEANFYNPFLVNGASIPSNASADYRLAPFHALTIGAQYSFPITANARLGIGAEYYWQVGDLSPPTNFGTLDNYDLFPKMDALMVRLGFSHDF